MASKEWGALANVDGGRCPQVGMTDCRLERKGPVQRLALESGTNLGATRSYVCCSSGSKLQVKPVNQSPNSSIVSKPEVEPPHPTPNRARFVKRLAADESAAVFRAASTSGPVPRGSPVAGGNSRRSATPASGPFAICRGADLRRRCLWKYRVHFRTAE